jgi:dTDP-glucose 4,6-dehydratase
MRILVCGGAGFIGSAFARLTLAEHADDEVVVYDKLTYAGNLANLAPVADEPRYRFIQGDIRDPGAVLEAISGGGGLGPVDAVVNFAAETHVDRSIHFPHEFIETDVFGTQVLLENARELGTPRFVQVSTDEVYGSVDEGAFTELSPLAPSSPYSASKAGGDLMVLAYHTTWGVPAMITRGSNTYGPYQYPEKLIPLFVTNLIQDRKVPVYGDGLNVRDWLYVDDHCRGIDAVLRGGQPGEVYNVGAGFERTNMQVTHAILDAMALGEDMVEYVEDRPGHDRRYALDSAKLMGLGWRPRVGFEQGLAETVAWYRERRDWWEPIMSGEHFATWRRANYEER